MRFLLIFVGAAILLATLSSCEGDSTQTNTDAQATTQEQTPSGVQTDFTAVPSGVSFSAADLDGQMHHSSEWLGKMPVVINVWGTWCPPCRREIPDLIRVYNEFRDQGIEMVGLAVRDTPEKVRKFTAQNEMEWVMLIANPQTTTTLGRVGGVPTTIFYDREGNEVERFVGARTYEVFKQTFEKIL
jgi:thiol-disulfide isomerase/thioredoxin